MPRNMFLMQQQLLIFFIYQQFLCHAAWATRTTTATATPLSSSSSSSSASTATSTFVPLNKATEKIITATMQTATTTSTSTPPPQVRRTTTTPLVVTASEATLLTGNLFPMAMAMMQQQRREKQNLFSAHKAKRNKSKQGSSSSSSKNKSFFKSESVNPATTTTSNDFDGNNNNVDNNNIANDGESRPTNRFKILAIHTNCSRDLFEMDINLNREFRGLLYAKDFPLECRARGLSQSNITLRLPASGCGVRAELRSDGNMELSVRIMLQMEQKLRQSSDILKTVRCQLPFNAMGMTVASKENNKSYQQSSNYRNGRMRHFGGLKKKNSSQMNLQAQEHESKEPIEDETNMTSTQASTTTTQTASSTPRVRIWLELGDKDGSGAVEVGQETTLTVRAIVPGKMGVRVVDCAALDGLGESTQALLDERGCPLDEQVMPALSSTLKPTEEGWSKQNDEDLVEKIFTAIFPAFKFPDRERLHVSCGVQLCKGACPEINCRSTEQLNLSSDKHLARIEVFNSLAVTAPQIEVDRLRYDRRYNMSAEEYPPYIRPLPSKGTLCMSVSKLAISFCVLGIIFLIAVIVAICSLIRSRRRDISSLTSNSSRIHRAEVCTSMFSSSSGESTQTTRFGSKLFMPYYPTTTLPYGRVY